MKRRLFALLLAALALLVAARAEDKVYLRGGLYHATPLCARVGGDGEWTAGLSARRAAGGELGEAAEMLLDGYFTATTEAGARELGHVPCPVCVQDDTDYGGLRAVERGGTAILRVPDAWIAEQPAFEVFGTAAGDTFTGREADRALARLLHGEAYAAFLEAVAVEGAAEARVLTPSLYPSEGALEMSARHIGGAWYLACRPGEADRARMRKDKKIEVELRLEGGAVAWSEDALYVEDGLKYEEKQAVGLEPIGGKPMFSGDFEGLGVTLFRELDANILVIRENPGDGDWLEGAALILDDGRSAEGLNGYLDGDGAVYVCVLADDEADALRAGAFPRLLHPGRVTARRGGEDGWRLEYVSGPAREESYDYTVAFRNGELWLTNNRDAACRPITVYLSDGEDGGSPMRFDSVPLGQTLLAFDKNDVSYRGNGAEELRAWAAYALSEDAGEVPSNTDRVWQAWVGNEALYVHTPPADGGDLGLFIDDAGSLYAQNAGARPVDGARVTLSDPTGGAGFMIASRQLDLPARGAALAFDASEVAAALAGYDLETVAAVCECGGGNEAYRASEALRWSAALYGVKPAPALPAPAGELSFLEPYADAVRVGDWYLACVAETEPEERFPSATRNTTAEWRLLDGGGAVLAKGLKWWPKGEDWPLMPRPFEGFEDGVDVAVIRIGEKYGLIDRAGNVVVEPKYDNIFGFLPGDALTPVERNGKWGAIDKAGNEVVPVRYDSSFSRFEGGCTVAERGGKKCLLGEDGRELLPAEYGTVWLDDGAKYGMARKGGTCMLFDRQGSILFEKELGRGGWIYCYADAVEPFPCYNGDTGLHSYVWADGSEALPEYFSDAAIFTEGSDTALVELAGGVGLIRVDGSFAVPAEYEWLNGYSEGLCAAQKDGLWGYLDEDGAVAIPFQFAYAEPFSHGYAGVRPAEPGEDPDGEGVGGPEQYGLIDRAGRWVIEPQPWAHIEVGADGVAVAGGFEPDAYYQIKDGSAEPVNGLPVPEHERKLAELDEAPELKLELADGAGLPNLDGVRRLEPLYAAFFRAVYPEGVALDAYDYWNGPVLAQNEAGEAWQRLCDGDADIIFVPAPGPEDSMWATLAARGQTPEFIPLCRDAVVFLANAANGVEDVSADELERVYRGEIADWGQLAGGGTGEIVAYQSPEESDDRAAFERLCAFEDLADAPEGVLGCDTFDGVTFTGPAGYRNLEDAMGYSLRSSCHALLEAGVAKALAVDGALPGEAGYPYVETLYAVRLEGNDAPNVLALLEWMRSAQGRELIEKAGFLPLE